MDNKKRYFLFASVVLAAAGGLALVWYLVYRNNNQAIEFVGAIRSINGNSISLEGKYIADKATLNFLPGDKITINFDSNTKIYRETQTLHKLTSADNKIFSPYSTRDENKEVTLTDLKTDWSNSQLNKKDLFIHAKTNSEVQNKIIFRADQLIYVIQVIN